jgi:hypothetical protein
LYYSNIKPDPKLAMKYYKLALEQCDEHGLDHFSDDVMGIKIQMTAWLESIGSFKSAIKVLEGLLEDCKRWVKVMEERVRDGTAPKYASPAPEPSSDRPEESQDVPRETLWGKRTRILNKAVSISVKLGELYSDEHVMEQEKAHDYLAWAVETALKEMRRRSIEGLKEGEGEWMSSDALGGAMECK